ncbi:ROR1 [Lepeophtheirus salmonis]|uniref:Tyrosine-protein kinase receptor n=1 Tax=Lepeophtheirus salmonis TaxID=72036 RepID=A0A7R8D3R8_LEPSM|nr:ROR1 [Lepeophtheirus salmonis]CAF3019456.1 ROR1 [Lepeophtheirus salmonis]
MDSKWIYSIESTTTLETSTPPSKPSLRFLYPLKNVTRHVGETLKLRCDVEGHVTRFTWSFNYEVLEDKKKGRIRVKHNYDENWSQLRIKDLEPLDRGYYICEASDGTEIIRAESTVKVNPVEWISKSPFQHDDEDGIIPQTFPLDMDVGSIEFQGRSPEDFNIPSGHLTSGLPSLKPSDHSGTCQRYTGTVCSKYVGSQPVFVSQGLRQDYIEKQLQRSLTVISNSPELSDRCAKYAIPAICLSTLPLCDIQTQKPRKICRDECEVLEYDTCHKELAIVKGQPMLNHQLVLPDCKELPVIGTSGNYNCVRLGIPGVVQLIKPHGCYVGNGGDYRGTVSVTSSGRTCKPWHLSSSGLSGNSVSNKELEEKEEQPWCYTNSPSRHMEPCGVPQCTDSSLWVYVAIPIAIAIGLTVIIILFVCFRRRGIMHRKGGLSSSGSNSPRSLITLPSSQNCSSSEMEMNSLLPNRAALGGSSAIRFIQELGDGAFGKVYRGDLGGIVGGCTTSVAIKTLRQGANTKTKQDFQREIDLCTNLKHPNIVCLLGVILKDEPQCLIFEFLIKGDLHEFLVTHSPKSGDLDGGGLDPSDMSFIAIQISGGLEYLSSHHYVHRDIATRNCLVGDNLSIKISDFGLARDIYASDYYRVQTKSLLPVRWMPPESILYGKFAAESDVWSFGVLLWEIYSYGLQPYYGYSNTEVIEMIRSRQLLPCPEDCSSRMYAFMVECWHEMPSRRPTFHEIHARLRQWEGMSGHSNLSGGYQSAAHSICDTSQHSGSQHSSTGPSNNTGSTNLSNNHLYQRPFAHLMSTQSNSLPPAGMVQMASGPNGIPHTLLVGNPQNGGVHTNPSYQTTTAASIASLQMV